MSHPDQPDRPDSALAEAILRTVLYADVFHFPLRPAEIHHFLIDQAATADDIDAALHYSPYLAAHLECIEGFFALRGHQADVIRRQAHETASAALWPKARAYGRLLAHLPFVRMVALTGSLAMHNAHSAADDIDYLLVTAPGRVWLARALAVLVVRLARLRGTALCPNYVLASSALGQGQRDLYIAHELAQMVPLAGGALYRAMHEANAWAAPLLPNAATPYYAEADAAPRHLGRFLQRLGELLLSGPLGDGLERWERRRKQRKFGASRGGAQLDAQHVKGHFNDHRVSVLAEYEARLRAYHLMPDAPRRTLKHPAIGTKP